MYQLLNAFDSDIMVFLKIQALASLVASSGEFLEERLDRVRTYYDLLTIPFEVSDLNCLTHIFCDMLWIMMATVSVIYLSIHEPRKDYFILDGTFLECLRPSKISSSTRAETERCCCRRLLRWCLRTMPYSAYQSEYLCPCEEFFYVATIHERINFDMCSWFI